MDYRTMVNPTYLTAKSTLHVLAAMGNTEAKDMMTALGTRDTLTRRNPKNPQTFLSEEDAKALMTGVSVAINARYEALSARMRKEGTKALLDIACGYTPRGLYCHRQGIDYVAETKGSIDSMQLREIEKSKIKCAKEHFKAISGDNVVYQVVDSYKSLMDLVMK